jgi:hypothetical protein
MSENSAEIPDDLVRRQDSPAVEPDSGPIIASGDDLADGGVGADGREHNYSPNTHDADQLPEVGIGGATSGAPHHPGYELDSVVTPGARSAPRADADDNDDAVVGGTDDQPAGA